MKRFMLRGFVSGSGKAGVGSLTLVLVGLAGAVRAEGPVALAAVTGLCPDGSLFVVHSQDQIPCSGAKQVEPHEVPPLRPHFLPRPYAWEVYREGADPNNPYNLIDAARAVRELRASQSDDAMAAPEGPGVSAARPGPEPHPGAGRPAPPPALRLNEEELRALFQLVELSQEVIPADFLRQTADGSEVLRIGLAHSLAFEARLREAETSPDGSQLGSVLLFTAVARRPAPFRAHFTFVQDHLAFQPNADDPAQLGALLGHLGSLETDEVVLGYVRLPAAMDLARPLEVYWNDRRRTVTFHPGSTHPAPDAGT